MRREESVIETTVDDCLIETTCGHPLKSGDAFYVYRNPATWHQDPSLSSC